MREVNTVGPQPRLSSQSTATEPASRAGSVPAEILRLAELVPVIRARVSFGHAVSDDTILLSLAEIDRHATLGDRWCAAFGSDLGRALAARRGDLGSALGTVLALLPCRVHEG